MTVGTDVRHLRTSPDRGCEVPVHRYIRPYDAGDATVLLVGDDEPTGAAVVIELPAAEQ